MSVVQYFRPSIMWWTIEAHIVKFPAVIVMQKVHFSNAPYMAIAPALGWGTLSDGWARAGRCGQETPSPPTDTA